MSHATASPGNPAVADVCTAATLYLMSHYARRPCPLLAHAIADQLARLGASGNNGIADVVSSLARALLPQWRQTAGGGTLVRH